MATKGNPERNGSVADVELEIGQIARGAGVGLGGNVVNYLLSYLFGILVARQVGADNYGLYTLGVTAVTLISRFTLVGLDRGLMRYASIMRGQGKGGELRRLAAIALGIGLVTGLAGALIFVLFPEWVLALFDEANREALMTVVPYLAISIPTLTLTGIAIAGTQAFRTMRYRALVVNIIQPIVKLVAALALIPLIGPTVAAPVLGFVIAQIVGTVLALFYLGRLARFVPRVSERTAGLGRRLVRFSTPLMAANVFDYLNGRTEILVIGIFLSASTVGVYNAALRLAGLVLIALTAFNAIFSPVISDLHHKGEMTRLSSLFRLVTRWTVTAAMPILLIQFLFAPQLMSLFGPEFVVGASALRLLSIGQAVNVATGSVGVMLVMSGLSDMAFFNSIVTVGVSLVLDFFLVPRFGLMGAAVAGTISIILINALRLIEVWRRLRLQPFDRTFARPLLAAIPAVLAGLAWIRWLPLNSLLYLMAACALVGAAYLGGILAQGLDEGDRMVLSALWVRVQRMLPRRIRKESKS